MNRLSLILGLTMISLFNVSGQVNSSTDSPNPLQFDQQEFRGRFAVLTSYDEKSGFFVVDMTQLKSRFEKVYFMMQTFFDKRIVSITSDISRDQMWFKANKIYPEMEIFVLFDQLKKKAIDEKMLRTEAQQAEWLKANDKYRKP